MATIMNPLVDDIFDIFPTWLYLSPSPLDYCDSSERMDRFNVDNHGQTQEECRFLPESMLEDRISNSASPAFAASLSSTFILPTPTPSFNDLMNYDHEQEILMLPHSSQCSSSSSQKSPPVKRNTRIGFCEHPKHVLYRQSSSVITTNSKTAHSPSHHHHNYLHHHNENHCQKHICKKLCRHHHYLHHLKQQQEGGERHPTSTASIATTPRRGRPPKGAKSSETTMPPLLSVSDALTTDLTLSIDQHHIITANGPCSLPVANNDNHHTTKINYHIPMTTRPLPKRLEPVIGKSNIQVCLTCLKRSDMDIDYLLHPTYIAPQSSKKKKKIISSLMSGMNTF